MPAFRVARLFGVASVVAALLTSCGSTPSPPTPDDALTVVAGAHSNAPTPELVGELAERVDDSVEAGAYATVVVNSGRPAIAVEGSLAVDCHNPLSCAKAQEESARKVAAAVTSSRAAAPENNLLGAADLGARALADHRGTRVLVVIDSGLQTVAPLRFQDPGMLSADPGEVADHLERVGALPRIGGMTVFLAGFGDTAEPQPPLTPQARQHLREIWDAVFRRAGAADVRFIESPLTSSPAAGLPPVTIVPVPEAASFSGPTVELTDADVAFQPESAELRDPAAARATLAVVAETVVARSIPVAISGTTAAVGSLKGQVALSRSRAEKVRAILVGELGVPADLINRVEGLGSDWPGYVMDHDDAGNLLPGPAAQNRRVIISAEPAP